MSSKLYFFIIAKCWKNNRYLILIQSLCFIPFTFQKDSWTPSNNFWKLHSTLSDQSICHHIYNIELLISHRPNERYYGSVPSIVRRLMTTEACLQMVANKALARYNGWARRVTPVLKADRSTRCPALESPTNSDEAGTRWQVVTDRRRAPTGLSGGSGRPIGLLRSALPGDETANFDDRAEWRWMEPTVNPMRKTPAHSLERMKSGK